MPWRRYLEDPALADFEALEVGGARIVVRRGYAGWVERLGLAGGEAAAVEEVGGGRRPHPLVELPGGERVLVRRYLRGGAVRHLNRERYFGGHRAFAELAATERARAAGVRAPEALAAAEHPRRLGYTARLATRWIPGALDLHTWLLARGPAAGEEAWREAGRQISLLHTGGVAHPDLNLRNLLVADAPGGEPPLVHVIDFDRARLYEGPVPAQRRARDLLRLVRSARKLGTPVTTAGWAALRAGYAGDWPLPSDPRG